LNEVTLVETFTELREFVENPHYHEQRRQCLAHLDMRTIDAPITDIVRGFADLKFCFPLQSCYGHFVYARQPDLHNIAPLPISARITSIRYRIAYIALCIESNKWGRDLFRRLECIPSIDPEYIQFGCAEWFWKQQVNSYALQVSPERYRFQDSFEVDDQEARKIEKVREQFFARLRNLLPGQR
jgi:hypothetical protein